MHSSRVWSLRDVAIAWALVVGSGVPTILFSPYDVDQPGSIPAYVLLCVVTVAIMWTTCMTDGRYRLPEWAAVSVLVSAVMALATWYGVWGPIIGATSDSLDALAVGVDQLMKGANPWGALTFLDNIPSPMLGGFILAVPFVVVPSALFLQPLVWLAAFVAFLVRTGGVHVAAVVSVLFFLSPWTRLAFPAGNDHWSVALVVVLTGTWGYWVLRDDLGGWHWWLSSLAFGVALSNRFTVWIAVIPLLALWWRSFDQRGIRWFVPAGVTTLVLVVGPVFVNPTAYLDGPIAVSVGKAEDGAVAHAAVLVAASTLLVTALLSWRVRDLAGAWLAVAGGLATLTGVAIMTKIPVEGWSAIGTYEGTAYNGAWFVFGLIGLAVPRGERTSTTTPGPAIATAADASRPSSSRSSARG
ncbi:hypothetical protein [Nocardioides zhouii]|uniref:DUF2029 domain-containing protein n=1 Tax=Nocardioides zhouii TaxID=1168729 RepID=A0A4Q2SYZ8_9ACTN|nr:hypothetical protein [Nocardioides zhouii]RYC11536.1 hypothetical protein EUA94_09245 [Nocardioides zhouii]